MRLGTLTLALALLLTSGCVTVLPSEDETLTVQGSVVFEDGSPCENATVSAHIHPSRSAGALSFGMVYFRAIGAEAKVTTRRDGSFTLSIPRYPAYDLYAKKETSEKFFGVATVDRRKSTDDFELVIVLKRSQPNQPPQTTPVSAPH